MKLYLLRFSDDLAYMEEIEYATHAERYEKCKGISAEHQYEPSELNKLLERIYELNRG